MKKKLGSILTINTAITALILTDFFVLSHAVVLAQNSQQQNRRTPSATYCHDVARNFADQRTRGGVLGGAASGAAAGALLGNTFGGRRGAWRRTGQGASAGAVAGGIAGGVRQTSERDRLYNLAFEECMQGRMTN